MAARPSVAHLALGEAFFDAVAPAHFPAHVLRYRNQPAAATVGLDGLTDGAWIEHFGRFAPIPGSLTEPIALRYHGHQFRSYNPDLGDGRGFLFAQLHDLHDGRLLDLGTKGSGQTPYARNGDGRLTLKGGVREVLATAMLAALGVETSRSFSLIETGEALIRQDEPSPTRAAVLVRLSHSHIRIGTFQRLAFEGDAASVARLVEHCIAHYLPEVAPGDVAGFFAAVCARVARTGAQWMAAGFVHGVLNTDNINITGESFDYGPWRFLPVCDPGFTAAYFDYQGLYAYGRQPEALLWNLAQLGGCLLPLADRAALEAGLGAFGPALRLALGAAVRRRLLLAPAAPEAEAELAEVWFAALQATQVPFAQAWFDWRAGATPYTDAAFDPVRAALAGFAPDPAYDPRHPYFQAATPCDLLVDEVEALWTPIAASDDWSAFEAKLASINAMADAYGTEPRSRGPSPPGG